MCPKIAINTKGRELTSLFPANIYLLKVNVRNTRKMCEICSKCDGSLLLSSLMGLQFLWQNRSISKHEEGEDMNSV